MKVLVITMVRVDECFECGASESKKKLIYSQNEPILCEDCYNKKNKSN